MFKVGDWVRYKHLEGDRNIRPQQIEAWTGTDWGVNGNLCTSSDLVQWKPRKGEWCVFPYGANGFCVSKFVEVEYHADIKHTLALFENGMSFDILYCEPFIGELPSFIKE